MTRTQYLVACLGFAGAVVGSRFCEATQPTHGRLTRSTCGQQGFRRSPPPAAWEAVVCDTFEADAFALLDGKRPAFGGVPDAIGEDRRQPQPTVDEDFDRSEIMKQLKRESMIIDELLASPQAVAQPTPQAKQAVANVLALGRRLANDDPDNSADVRYVKHAEEMTNAARRLQQLLGTARHGEARDTIRGVNSSCTACHNTFNP